VLQYVLASRVLGYFSWGLNTVPWLEAGGRNQEGLDDASTVLLVASMMYDVYML
jgi:hypothetical protein